MLIIIITKSNKKNIKKCADGSKVPELGCARRQQCTHHSNRTILCDVITAFKGTGVGVCPAPTARGVVQLGARQGCRCQQQQQQPCIQCSPRLRHVVKSSHYHCDGIECMVLLEHSLNVLNQNVLSRGYCWAADGSDTPVTGVGAPHQCPLSGS